jgi:hypothetical protein
MPVSKIVSSIDVPDGEKFIHFNFYDRGTTLTLEPLDATEYAKLMA